MAIVRLYSGSDGESHFEEVDLNGHPELTSLTQVSGISFRRTEGGHFMDWHNAPQRQLVFTLEGDMEITIGDGTVRKFGPGDVLWAEDLTGKGHTTRHTRPRLTASVPLGNSFS